MNILRMVSWGVGIAVAVFVGMSSLVIVNQGRNSARAYALGIPPSSTAAANLAFATYAARQLENPKAAVTPGERTLAARAYRTEPLSSAALGLLIASTPNGANVRARQALLDLGGKLTRRSSLINAEQIKSAAFRGDDKAFFLWLSRSVLTNDRLRTAYIGAMAGATARDGAVEALAPVIGTSPAWADYYWQLVSGQKVSLANAAKLRIAVAGAPWRQTEITVADENLLLALTRARDFDAASALAGKLGQGESPFDTKSGALQNANFARQPKLPPFDWLLARSGTLGSSIDDRSKSLLVSAIGGARGVAASQLVQLSPGDYRLSWSSSSNAPIDPTALSARVHCAEPGVNSVRSAPVPLTVGKGHASIAIADSACRWYWVAVYVALPDDSSGMDVYFHNISLTPGAIARPEGA